jgi:uncharacterized SAM-binding protein YcdF (DUF218 family)
LSIGVEDSVGQTVGRSRAARVGMLLAGLVLVVVVAGIVVCYRTVPARNTELTRFDALLVLGTPADDDGRPSYSGKWLVDEAVRELGAGRAERIILTGGPVRNKYAEARVLADYAAGLGVPRDALIEDDQSRNTLENVTECARIMRAHGWQSVEVIGTKEHLPRAAVLMEKTGLLWSTHAAVTPDRSTKDIVRHTVMEAVATTGVRVFGVWTVPWLHRLRMALREG